MGTIRIEEGFGDAIWGSFALLIPLGFSLPVVIFQGYMEVPFLRLSGVVPCFNTLLT